MADDIDIKDHDILLDPRMRDYLFALNIKTEPTDYEEKYKLQTDDTNDIFVEEKVQAIKIEPKDEVVQKPKEVRVCLEDCAHRLNSSPCYCKECAILFANRNALDLHNMAAHSLLVAVKTVPTGAPIKTQYRSLQDVAATKKGKLDEHSKDKVLFSQKRCLKNMKKQHSGKKPYQCDHCEKRFVKKHSLVLHIRTYTGERPHQCNVCPKAFLRKCRLTEHMRTHTGEKPYQCNVCKRTFSAVPYLKQHIRTHTGEKPYQCKLCEKSFAQKQYLASHIRTHTGERPYECNVCPKSFSQKNDLTSHIRTHTGEKPHQCNVCQKTFTQRTHLNRHFRTHTYSSEAASVQCLSEFQEIFIRRGGLKLNTDTFTVPMRWETQSFS